MNQPTERASQRCGLVSETGRLARVLRAAVEEARAVGWAVVQTSEAPSHIGEAVGVLGRPLRSRDRTHGLERLVPVTASRAHARSLSADHGLGRFPLHTDCAHWPTPPRWVFLWCDGDDETSRPTTLLRWSDVWTQAVYPRPVTFLVRNSRNSFFTVVGTKARFDEGCMTPRTPGAHLMTRTLDALSTSEKVAQVSWTRGLVLIIDNHAVLHGRDEAAGASMGRRVLQRGIIEEIVP